MKDVFIVEDEEMLQQLYTDVLTMKGYNIVGIASTGEEAVKRYKEFPSRPDLVIMDHRMPGMGGLEAAQVIRTDDPEANIILVSADDTAVWESIKLGIVGMRKPFSITDLIATIESSSPKDASVKPLARKVPPIPSGIKGSGLYLIDEEDGKKGMEVLSAFLENGYKGICFTRKHPDTVRSRSGLQEIPIVWFSTTPSGSIPTISPQNVQKILIMLQTAMSESDRTVILVMGYEFILTNLEFERSLNLVQVLNDRTMAAKDTVVIFSLDTSILPEREAKLLRREFKVLERNGDKS